MAAENVAKEFVIGNTRIKICDDYCKNKSPEEVDAILRGIAIRATECLVSAADE